MENARRFQIISDMKKKINTLAMTIALLEAKVPSDKKEGS